MAGMSARGAVEPFHAMDVLREANALADAGRDVLSLAVGQPSASAPVGVLDAAEHALRNARLGYTDALGRTDSRRAVARHYADHYGVEVPAERIALTTGSSAGFSLAFLAVTDPGGRIAITAPGYPAYRNIIKALSLEAVEIETDPDEDHMVTVAMLEAAHREKPLSALLIASPANPTGAVTDRHHMNGLMDFCRDEGIAFISDEIYHRLRYTGDDRTALAHSHDVIVINSFSKYYCMTGWRIGWMVLPEELVRPVERLAQSLYISAPDLAQIAAPKAFECTQELDRIKDGYRANRALLLKRLPAMGISFAAPPDGAFYAWCDVSRHTNDSMDLARRMLAEINVAAAPGLDFDPVNGHRFMRFSYAGSGETVARAIARMENWIGK
ncbi:pyridoxal phosphate-dependent aminotransferase [Oricola cellulosilytica]|uniref:aspartate transaminase n=1 Tax=Oricola cellulosilytica TaxID=1429082 RepID=A0A4R0PDV1_9HYPH|nr:aminotransferase class I/II-fold pyridoxal phosphate-dependent enzyme [Oricola cellulosilytica]TCD14509.1 aminotransferase class I/II-fold pyridoxal phosphate-dependent enzyme [Oricola cellulosilytica]